MRVLVGDVLGQCRLVDAWGNSVLGQVGGNKENQVDRSWECGSIAAYSDFSRACMIHSSGYASFLTVDSKIARNSVLSLCSPSPAKSLSLENDRFIACFSGKCVYFTERNRLGSFDTVQCSCAASKGNQAAYGRIGDRTLVYDISSGAVKWTSGEPPFDELKIQLQDDDRSLLWINEDLLVVGQNEGTALVYDIRSGNEAVIRANPFPEFPLTALALYEDMKVVFGDTIGGLTIMDLNMPMKRFDGFRGFHGAPAGNVQIVRHPSLPLISVLTCDRVVRVYDVTKRLRQVAEKSAFVKVMGKCLVMMNDGVPEPEDASDDEWNQLPEDGDGLWDNFVACPQAKPKNDK